MEKLNNKIKNGRTEKIDDAQMVGNYGYDSTIDKLRRLTCDTNGALHVDVHGGSAGSGDLKCRTDIANPATSTFVKCNADGTLEMTAELSSAGLATSAIQTDGTQKARCMGAETSGTQQQLLTSNNGTLQTFDNEVFGKTAQIANQTTLSNVNEATIIANQTNGTQKATVGNTVGDGSGTAKHLLTNANGELLVNFGSATTQNVNCFGKDGGGTPRELLLESNGAFVLGGGSSSALGNTASDGTGDAKFLACDADGHLQVDILSGGGGSTPTTTATVLFTGATQVIGTSSTVSFVTGLTGMTQFSTAGVRDLTYIIEGSGTNPSLTVTEMVGATAGVLAENNFMVGAFSSVANFACSSTISAQHRGLKIKNNSGSDTFTVTKITAIHVT